MNASNSIRCTVYLYGDVDRDDAALIEQLSQARPGRRAQRFLAIARMGLAGEQAGQPASQHDVATRECDRAIVGDRLAIHLKLNRHFQPQIVAAILGVQNRSARLRELAVRGLRSDREPGYASNQAHASTAHKVDTRHRADLAQVHATPSVLPSMAEGGHPLDAMLTEFVTMTENGV